jgi:hypothetical protein
MPLTYRAITGTWTLPDGGLPGRAVATLSLIEPDWTSSDFVIPTVIELVADADGDVVPGPSYVGDTVEVDGKDRAVIWASEDGAQQAVYRINVIGSQDLYSMGDYLIPPGESALTLQDILELGIPSSQPRYLTVQSYIDSLTIAPAYGQCSRTTNSSIAIAQAGAYVPINLAATLDTANSVQFALVNSGGLGLKYTGEFTRAIKFYASVDAGGSPNKTYGIRLAVNTQTVPQTECRAFHPAGAAEAKLVTSWILTLDPDDEVQIYITNHTDTTAISFQRGRVVASSIAGFVAES